MIARKLNELELTGRSRTHVVQIDAPRFAAQPEVAEAFLALRTEALKSGFDLMPVSSFRGFNKQLSIWNSKFAGKSRLFDMEGKVRDFSRLSPNQVIDCILNWSALPGGSRHHWGTEIDVVDRAAMALGYKPKLLPEEVSSGGIFHPLHLWLDKNIERFDFFRPYKRYTGGMYPEPWHLSYAPLSIPAVAQVSIELLQTVIQESDIMSKDLVLERIPAIYRDHILNYVLPEDQ